MTRGRLLSLDIFRNLNTLGFNIKKINKKDFI